MSKRSNLGGKICHALSSKNNLMNWLCFSIGCGAFRMSSIPMGAHAAFKVRSTLNCGDKNEKQQPSMSFTNTEGRY